MDVLHELDTDLNIYALANGMELLRDRVEAPDRVLTWYADRAERQIVVRAASGGDAVDVGIGVGGGGPHHRPPEHLESFRRGVAPTELRHLLDEATSAANALARPDRE